MKFGADNLPDDLVLLKALILQLQEENALLRHKLFSPKSERSPEDCRLAAAGHVQRGRRADRRAGHHAKLSRRSRFTGQTSWQTQAAAGHSAARGSHP